ncbi:hypothetical protein BDQ17DRAFT_1333950 [Cyathus striatus]|nr:hypothetical protein BDQ17DRAFT_1333950 [Cyathus striatus]
MGYLRMSQQLICSLQTARLLMKCKSAGWPAEKFPQPQRGQLRFSVMENQFLQKTLQLTFVPSRQPWLLYIETQLASRLPLFNMAAEPDMLAVLAAAVPKESPLCTVIGKIIPGFKSDALDSVIPPRVDTAFATYAHVPYSALTKAALDLDLDSLTNFVDVARTFMNIQFCFEDFDATVVILTNCVSFVPSSPPSDASEELQYEHSIHNKTRGILVKILKQLLGCGDFFEGVYISLELFEGCSGKLHMEPMSIRDVWYKTSTKTLTVAPQASTSTKLRESVYISAICWLDCNVDSVTTADSSSALKILPQPELNHKL